MGRVNHPDAKKITIRTFVVAAIVGLLTAYVRGLSEAANKPPEEWEVTRRADRKRQKAEARKKRAERQRATSNAGHF